MLKKEIGQSSFFGDMIYDRLFRKRSHWLKELLDVIDFSFINDLCQDLYESSTGRPAWSPRSSSRWTCSAPKRIGRSWLPSASKTGSFPENGGGTVPPHPEVSDRLSSANSPK